MVHTISMKNFQGHLGINWSTEKKIMMSSVTWFSSNIVFWVFFNPFKKFFSKMTELIKEKPYGYDHLSMKNKKFPTYDIIGHMVWRPDWIYPKTFENLLQAAGQRRETSHTHSSSLGDTRVFMNKLMSHDLAAIFD